MKLMDRTLALLLAAALAAPGPALAQGASRAPARPQQQAPQAPQEAPPPPYEPQLLRLSEILGALAWLREVCGEGDGDQWRASMRSLMEAEARTETRRERLAGAYNRGFQNYETLYRACTPNAHAIIERFLDEGGKLADDVTNRFGGG
jgi:uncharacterized protein (TIGR02301 family)